MSRRASLPGAAELFRTTGTGGSEAQSVPSPTPIAHPGVGAVPSADEVPPPVEAVGVVADVDDLPEAPRATPAPRVRTGRVRSTRRVSSSLDRVPTGRQRHDEKITVYCSPEELLDLEQARLQLRAEHGLAVDRGRIVREAVAVVLADLEAKGETSILVRRLREA